MEVTGQILDENGHPIEEVLTEEEKEVREHVPEIKPHLLPEEHAWKNVISLMETQNEIIQKTMQGVKPAIEELNQTITTAKNAVKQAADKIEELQALQAAQQTPEEIDAATGGEVTPEVKAEETQTKRSGLRWKR